MRQFKICSKCHQEKELVEFHIDNSKPSKRRPDCKTCHTRQKKAYRQTEQGKATSKRWSQNYNHSERGRVCRKRFRGTEKYKKAQKESRERYHSRYPERLKAKSAVCSAIIIGKMPRANTFQCHYCPAQAEQYHHYRGYAPKYWLDVLPACGECHRRIHKRRKYA